MATAEVSGSGGVRARICLVSGGGSRRGPARIRALRQLRAARLAVFVEAEPRRGSARIRGIETADHRRDPEGRMSDSAAGDHDCEPVRRVHDRGRRARRPCPARPRQRPRVRLLHPRGARAAASGHRRRDGTRAWAARDGGGGRGRGKMRAAPRPAGPAVCDKRGKSAIRTGARPAGSGDGVRVCFRDCWRIRRAQTVRGRWGA